MIGKQIIPGADGRRENPPLGISSHSYGTFIRRIHPDSRKPLGTMGLLALALGTLLNLPVTGTYHTDISQCVDNLTDDDFMEESAWLYMIWFYGRMDEVTVPSQSTRKQLIDRGLDPDKIRPLPRWVDMETFSPSKRDAGIWKRYGLSDDVKFLYAGRVSKEKIWNGWPRHLQPPCAEAPARV